MLVLAHRGAHKVAIENTLDAFADAVAAGFDGIETDIQLTADEALVLFHDNYTSDGVRVDQLTTRQLSDRVGYPVPLLAEALEEPADIIWNLEVKTRSVVRHLIPLLRPLVQKKRLLVSYFIHPAVCEILADLDIDGGLLIAHDPLDICSCIVQPASSRARSLIADYETISEASLKRAAANGLRTYLYNLPASIEPDRLAQLGLQGIITDHAPRHSSASP